LWGKRGHGWKRERGGEKKEKGKEPEREGSQWRSLGVAWKIGISLTGKRKRRKRRKRITHRALEGRVTLVRGKLSSSDKPARERKGSREGGGAMRNQGDGNRKKE